MNARADRLLAGIWLNAAGKMNKVLPCGAEYTTKERQGDALHCRGTEERAKPALLPPLVFTSDGL